MGKAARAKREKREARAEAPPEHLERLRAGRCMRCGAPRERQATVWCDGCTRAAQRRRDSLTATQHTERAKARREGHVFTAKEAGMYRIQGLVKFDDP